MDIVDLDPADPRLTGEVLDVLQELRPHLTAESLPAIYAEGHPQGLRFTAGYLDGRCVAVAGWRIIVNTSSGRKLYVDDLVTAAARRGEGAGRALVDELTWRAEEAGCSSIDLDSGTQRVDAHRFYLRERFVISSFHFKRRVN